MKPKKMGPLGIPGTPSSIPPGPDSEQNFSKKQQICSMYIPISNTLTNKFMMGYNLFES